MYKIYKIRKYKRTAKPHSTFLDKFFGNKLHSPSSSDRTFTCLHFEYVHTSFTLFASWAETFPNFSNRDKTGPVVMKKLETQLHVVVFVHIETILRIERDQILCTL